MQSLETGVRKTLIEGGSDARYVPTGHIVYASGGTLFAVPFDLAKLEVTGGAVPVVEGVRRGYWLAARPISRFPTPVRWSMCPARRRRAQQDWCCSIARAARSR